MSDNEMDSNSDGAALARDRLLSAFHAEYLRADEEISMAAVERKFLKGIAFWEDLQLEGSMALVRRLNDREFRETAARTRLILTREFQRLLDALCSLTMEDSLTGLFNRRYFDSRLVQEMRRALRDGSPCSLMMVDIDHFKKTNDVHGHQAGDQMLAHVARTMEETLRASDVFARFGGEEFTIILPSTDGTNAEMTGERVRAAVEASPLPLEDGPIQATVSVGISTYAPPAYITPEQLIRQADAAMYKAKQAGRNRCKLFSARPDAQAGVSAEERAALFK